LIKLTIPRKSKGKASRGGREINYGDSPLIQKTRRDTSGKKLLKDD